MGEVWKAYEANLDRDVAIKMLLRGVLDDTTTRERFRREAEEMQEQRRLPLSPLQRSITMASSFTTSTVMTSQQLLESWQGHRALTRRVIEAFPEHELFSHTLGGMRPFSALAMEFIGMAVPTLQGVITGKWDQYAEGKATTKAELLKKWDDGTAEINALWPTIPTGRFQEVDTAFGQWKMAIYDLLLYVRDNEIHHRGQGYVYLRSLGIEPPPFWERV